MKKTLRIALCAVLTFALVFSFTACSDDTDTKKVTRVEKEDGEGKAEAKKVAKEFMDALCELDIDVMADCCADGDAFKEELGFEDLKEAIVAGINDGDVDPAFVDAMDPVIDGLMGVVADTIEYRIVDVAEDGDDYIVTVEYTTVDFEALTQYLETAFDGETSEKLGEDIALELVENGTITQNSTQEEIVAALMQGLADRIVPDIKAEMDNIGTTTDTAELAIVEKDDKWYVDEDSTDFVKTILE